MFGNLNINIIIDNSEILEMLLEAKAKNWDIKLNQENRHHLLEQVEKELKGEI